MTFHSDEGQDPKDRKAKPITNQKADSARPIKTISYEKSGVNVQTGDDFVDWIQSSQKKQIHQDRIVSGVGGFASLFKIGFPEMKNPCLVTCTDGVGTKVKLAADFNRFEEVAQDCVAMCVNDLICTGGRPLLFLDYYAVGKLDLERAKKFLNGLKKACEKSDCALVGGETAEMPGVYQENDFDCAGFAVGIVDEDKTLGAHRVQSGDRLIGISSSGFHSNGYSLLRKVFAQDLEAWIEKLIQPTALYVQIMKELQESLNIHAAAHITGGGIQNIPRVLPEHLEWQLVEWQFPEEFLEVQRRTGLSDAEMRETLNCGIGFVVILPESEVKEATKIIQRHGHKTYDLGQMKART